MPGSARSLQISMFAGLRVASTTFTPEYSKNGKNISAKLVCNSFMNIASRANDGAGRNEAIPFTIWGKLAHVCAKSMSEGKEWNCISQLHVYDGRVFMPGVNGQPGTPILDHQGQPITTKKFSFTVSMLTFGEESWKHIQNEMQTMINGAPLRPAQWNVPGTQDYANWRAILEARMAIQFDPNLPTYGYARIRMPEGPGIGAYLQNTAQANANVSAAVATPEAVKAAFTGTPSTVAQPITENVNVPAAAVVENAVAAPPVSAQGFVVRPGV